MSTDHLPDELVIELRKPIEVGSEVYMEIRLREPTAGEVEKAQKALIGPNASPTMSDIVMVSLVSGLPKPVVERIPYSDFEKAVRYLMGFTGGGLTTGATS
ncbi:phage tail assembly protein [Azospirillum cavernae]|uniref:Phage tail assembly protein n=1 Tax=Azospirillum cavernae TaxID=2320860 RepID=A0A418W0F7_9PROT|nr:phage tail assembly protein [Azospirillum cavernae]RJF83458.1 phage tail assembly protein [Azospirillum cavernae]